MAMEIADWRKRIDELDKEIVRLISERAEAARNIGLLKAKSSMAVYEPNREQQVFDHVKSCNAGPLPDSELHRIYERILDVMRTLQKKDQ